MTGLTFNGATSQQFPILCLGCHSDDIEIGCGGTVLKLAKQYPQAVFHWVVFSAEGARADEARKAANLFVPADRLQGPAIKAFPDGFLPYVASEVKTFFEDLKRRVSPSLIFTHNRRDAHQDHRLLAELTWNTFRNHLILEYEIPKYDGDMGQPSVFVPLGADMYSKKIKYIMNCFESQSDKPWFREETFRSLMRIRGMECNAPTGYAEAFYCRKLVL